jgi:hypothetical protein
LGGDDLRSDPARAHTRDRRSQRGAAVVEAGLVISLFLIPMLVGVLVLGEKLWQAQKHGPYEPRVAPSQIIGTFGCTEIVDRVQTTVANNIAGLGVPIETDWVSARVVEVAPTAGVLMEVAVTVPPADGSGDPYQVDAALGIDNATLTAETCL